MLQNIWNPSRQHGMARLVTVRTRGRAGLGLTNVVRCQAAQPAQDELQLGGLGSPTPPRTFSVSLHEIHGMGDEATHVLGVAQIAQVVHGGVVIEGARVALHEVASKVELPSLLSG